MSAGDTFYVDSVEYAAGSCPGWAELPSMDRYKMVVAKIVKPDLSEILFPDADEAENYLELKDKDPGDP